MTTLKGQNFRICTYDTTAAKYKVVGMATGCTVTLTNNTDDASTKDDVGMASKPTTISKSWQVSVESLSVADAAAMLTAIKSLTPFTLMWDETSTTDNQTREKATFARKGTAYLSDVTFNFNDRENATKSLQFTGSGALQAVGSSEATEVIALGSYTKGQFVRLFLGSDNTAAPSTVIAAAKASVCMYQCRWKMPRQRYHWRMAGTGAYCTQLRHLHFCTHAQWRHHYIGRWCKGIGRPRNHLRGWYTG